MCKDVWKILGLHYDNFICNKRDWSELILFLAKLISCFDVSIIT